MVIHKTDTVRTDMLLVRCKLAQPTGLRAMAQALCGDSSLGPHLRVTLDVAAWSPETQSACIYARPVTPSPLSADTIAATAALWQKHCPDATDIDVSRLQAVQEIAGASAGQTATRHYFVETDVDSGWDDEMDRWYGQEHLPGLASVPGTVLARRFINHDSGPRSHGCYALVTEEALNSPPWLAVRGTEWSSRVRPHFVNTRREMMRIEG